MARNRRSRGARHEVDGTPERTYGAWGIVGVFVALGLIGLFVLLFIRPSGDESVRVPTSQTMPEGYEDPAASDPDDEGERSAAPTLPGGAPAPEGVSSVEAADGTTSVTFDPPAGATTDEGELAAGWTPAIATAVVEPTEDGRELVIRVPCSTAEDEFLAQLTVTEADAVVTVAAVVVVPDSAAPCADSQDRHVLTVRLTEPLGSRQLTVVPEGTPLDPASVATGS
jgi:hypothetical protein